MSEIERGKDKARQCVCWRKSTQNSRALPQKSPIFRTKDPQKTPHSHSRALPVLLQKRPKLPHSILLLPQKSPISSQKSPIASQKSPISSQKSPISSQKSPIASQKRPKLPHNTLLLPQKSPIFPQKSPAYPTSADKVHQRRQT